jgi:mono/diheme cytochrome c family protein
VASADSEGQRLFEGACASCHQWNGAGQQTPYASLAGTRGVNDPKGANVTQAILHGVTMRIGDTDVYMPAFGHGYSDPEVAALANFVIGHFGGKQGEVTAEDVAKRRDL